MRSILGDPVEEMIDSEACNTSFGQDCMRFSCESIQWLRPSLCIEVMPQWIKTELYKFQSCHFIRPNCNITATYETNAEVNLNRTTTASDTTSVALPHKTS